jgi:hypothetical protein
LTNATAARAMLSWQIYQSAQAKNPEPSTRCTRGVLQ